MRAAGKRPTVSLEIPALKDGQSKLEAEERIPSPASFTRTLARTFRLADSPPPSPTVPYPSQHPPARINSSFTDSDRNEYKHLAVLGFPGDEEGSEILDFRCESMSMHVSELGADCAPLGTLLRKLILDDPVDPSLIETFFLFAPSFCTPHEVWRGIHTAWFSLENAVDLRPKRFKAVQLRLVQLIVFWLSANRFDFSRAMHLQVISTLRHVAAVPGANLEQQARSSARVLLSRLLQQADIGALSRHAVNICMTRLKAEGLPSTGSLATTLENLVAPDADDPFTSLLAVPALEIAQQLLRINHETFADVPAHEFHLYAIGATLYNPERCQRLAQTSNTQSDWIATEIVKLETAHQRAALYSHVLDVCRHLLKLNDYSGLGALLMALQSNAVFRLSETKALLDAEHKQLETELQKVIAFDRNYHEYRHRVLGLTGCVVPLFPVLFSDLVKVEQNTPTFVPFGDEEEMAVNWSKFNQLGYILDPVLVWQSLPPTGVPLRPRLRSLLVELPGAMREDALFQLSLERERPPPRLPPIAPS